jgi:hypothetical protein
MINVCAITGRETQSLVKLASSPLETVRDRVSCALGSAGASLLCVDCALGLGPLRSELASCAPASGSARSRPALLLADAVCGNWLCVRGVELRSAVARERVVTLVFSKLDLVIFCDCVRWAEDLGALGALGVQFADCSRLGSALLAAARVRREGSREVWDVLRSFHHSCSNT